MDLVDLLNHRGIEYRKTNNPSEILISCTSGEHVDKSPSLSYNLEKNVFHCWSCGFSGGITKFMVSIGETVRLDVDSKQPYKIKKLKDKIRKVVEQDEIKLPEENRETIEVKAGSLVLIHGMTPHGSLENSSEENRPVYLSNYIVSGMGFNPGSDNKRVEEPTNWN